MRSRSVVVLCLLCAMLLSVAGCVVPPTAQTPAATVSAPETALPGTTVYPLRVTDDLGREVIVSARPGRIVSLAPSVTEVLFATGAGEWVVGVTEYCDYPPEAREGRETVGGFSAKSLSVEKIVSLRPDVVFSAGTIQQSVIDALEQAEITVVALDPRGFDGIYQDILLVGQIVDRQEVAEALVADMQARVAAITQVVAGIPADKRPRVFYEVWDEPLMTAGPSTFIGQMIEMAGGQNIFAEVPEEYPQISAEMVVARNPDLILGPDSHAEGLTPEKIAARPGWQDIPAVREGHIWVIDGNIASRSGPRVVDGLEIIAHLLYPDLFE